MPVLPIPSSLFFPLTSLFDSTRRHEYIMTKDKDFAAFATLGKNLVAVVWVGFGNATNAVRRNWLTPLLQEIIECLTAGETRIDVV